MVSDSLSKNVAPMIKERENWETLTIQISLGSNIAGVKEATLFQIRLTVMQVAEAFHNLVVNVVMYVIPDLITPLLRGPTGFQK